MSKMSDKRKACEELVELLKEYNVTNVPDFLKMSTDEIRSYLKEIFIHALQDGKVENFAEKAMCLKQLIMPSQLFQYRSFDKWELKKKALEENYIWLSEPNKFNDPYDCAGCFDINQILSDGYINKDMFPNNQLIKKVKEDLKNGEDFYTTVIKYNKSMTEDDKEKFSSDLKKLIEDKMNEVKTSLQKKVKICCLTESNTNALMWSHYASSHTGFCVEYDISALEITNDFNMKLFPAVYTKDPIGMTKAFRLFPSRLDIIQHIFYMNKSISWKYEQEWRFIKSADDIKNAYVMPTPLKAIYLGSKISSENEYTIRQVAKDRKIRVFKMGLKSSSFEMEVVNN